MAPSESSVEISINPIATMSTARLRPWRPVSALPLVERTVTNPRIADSRVRMIDALTSAF
jgi:hypothetical protein